MKNISTDTFKISRIDISLFLTVLLFCCLLFMEEEEEEEEEKEEEEEEAYEKLCTDLGKLLDKLRDLRIDINDRKLITTGAFDSKIDSLIQRVNSARLYLDDNVPDKNIKKNINIVSEVYQAQNTLSRVLKQKSHYSSEELSALLDQVEEIWQQIQVKVKEAVRSAHH